MIRSLALASCMCLPTLALAQSSSITIETIPLPELDAPTAAAGEISEVRDG